MTALSSAEVRRCERCGSTAFLADEAITYLVVDGEIRKTYDGDGTLCNVNCLRCLHPDLYEQWVGGGE